MGSSVSQHNLRLHLYSKLFSFKWCGNLKGLSSETETAKRGRGENVEPTYYLVVFYWKVRFYQEESCITRFSKEIISRIFFSLGGSFKESVTEIFFPLIL